MSIRHSELATIPVFVYVCFESAAENNKIIQSDEKMQKHNEYVFFILICYFHVCCCLIRSLGYAVLSCTLKL